jgi:putative DNA primase/helicase
MQTNTINQNEIDTPFPLVMPWHETIDPAELLTSISNTIQRFIICPPETAHAATLWIAMTWFIDVVQVAPLAIITAPEKRCGKSQFLFLLARLVNRPLAASNITPAALFRSIDTWKPTLLIDEADTFMRENEELRGLLNCGHTRDSAKIIRIVGDKHIPKYFNVWGAKALAGIGRLADTLVDRSISLELRRKLPHEKTERLRHAEPESLTCIDCRCFMHNFHLLYNV